MPTMPSTSKNGSESSMMAKTFGHNDTCKENGWCRHFLYKLLLLMSTVTLVFLVVYLNALTNYQLRRTAFVGRADRLERQITVQGFGKAIGANDIALTSIGYSNIDKDVLTAQTNNKKVMDAVIAELKNLGIQGGDLETDAYSIYPEYDYSNDKGQTLRGYRVTQQVSVKIRDLAKISSVLAVAGKYGANQVNGLTFTIDNPENLKVEARDKAVADARQKAERLAAQLGVRILGVMSYSESEGGAPYPVPMYRGGMTDAALSAAAPEVATGSKDIMINTSITYEIAP